MQTASVVRTIEELLARSAVYHALGVLLRYPEAGAERGLAQGEHRQLLLLLERVDRGGAARLEPLGRRIVRLLDETNFSGWVRQHEQTFGHAVQGISPPYELEYGEEHSHRQPHELGDIAAFYTAFGLRLATSSHERVDHIATQCEFLHYLLYKHACAMDESHPEHGTVCGEAVGRFLADHVGRWGPAFALRLSRSSGPLLAAVGALLLAWLIEDCGRMQVPVGSCDLPLRLPKERDDVGCAACLPAAPDGPAQAGTLQPGQANGC